MYNNNFIKGFLKALITLFQSRKFSINLFLCRSKARKMMLNRYMSYIIFMNCLKEYYIYIYIIYREKTPFFCNQKITKKLQKFYYNLIVKLLNFQLVVLLIKLLSYAKNCGN